MQWYYASADQQQGPVSQDELEALARAGTVTPETLVWRDGLPNWVAYSTVATNAPMRALAAAAPATGAGLERCAECGQTFPKDSMVAFENSHICATCKPLFFQKLREGVTTGGAGMWRSKKQLVTTLNPVLPARCVKCNAPTETAPLKRNLYWHHPLIYLALLVNVIVYVIIAMLVRKRSTAMVSICPEHRAQRRNAILVAWVLVLGGIAAIIAGVVNDTGWLAVAGVAAFLGGLIYGIVRGRLVFAAKIDKERMWLGGCGKDFLAEFPEWSGP